MLQKLYDDIEVDRKTRERANDLAGIQTAVLPAMQKLHATSTRVAAVAAQSAKDLVTVAKQVADLGTAATPKLKADLKALQDERAAWPAGASVAEIGASVSSFETALKSLVAAATALVDSQPAAVLERQRKALQKSLKTYDEAAFSLTTTSAPTRPRRALRSRSATTRRTRSRTTARGATPTSRSRRTSAPRSRR